MKSRYLPLLAALLTIGLLGASGSTTAAATIEYSISGAQAADIEITDLQQSSNISDDIAAQRDIANAIWANHINRRSIAPSISDISLIAIASIIDANIEDNQIAGAITQIAA